MTDRKLTTADIGVAIRDHLEDKEVEALDWEGDAVTTDDKFEIQWVDLSDAHNPIVHTTGGIFRVSIVKVG
jgi:hypothetical protein